MSRTPAAPTPAGGLVARHPLAEDGRGRVVTLTQSGRTLIDEMYPVHLTTEEALLAPLDAAERAQLEALLIKLAIG
ncbi:hypothetical protein AB0301_05250 [Microbacterium profundi]|uniref:HTH marR-type domain-containing protein n=1 Tax=Microbacterium profundi TaxID=450380 RepID=A0ABV3LEZ1_9MICO